MNLHSGSWMGFAALLFASGITLHAAEQPARSRGTPIIFSAPSTSDTVASNLNELRTPSTPFRDIEAELKKPFDAFDPIRGGNSSRPLSRQTLPAPPQPQMNKRTLKEQMNQRAEQMFLTPELFEGEDDPFQLSEESIDPYKQKPRTTLDRYYDRLDRNRFASTNRPTGTDPLDGKAKDRADDFGGDHKTGNDLDPNPSTTTRTLPIMSDNSPSSDGYFSGRAKMAPSSPFGVRTDDAFNRKLSPQETRLEDFKRLLEGSSYKPRAGSAPLANFGTTSPSPSSTAITPSYTWSSSVKPTTTPASPNAFATSAGLVGTPGTPKGLPDFSASSSLSTPPLPPPQAKPLPPSTFNIPRRRL